MCSVIESQGSSIDKGCGLMLVAAKLRLGKKTDLSDLEA